MPWAREQDFYSHGAELNLSNEQLVHIIVHSNTHFIQHNYGDQFWQFISAFSSHTHG